MKKLENKLQEGLLIFDGAIGTEIYRKNFFINTSYEELSLSRPDILEEIHNAYLNAGAGVLTTNTYNANSRNLSHFGLSGKAAVINQAAVKIARTVANGQALIAASVGPVEHSEIENDEVLRSKILADQVSALDEADFIIFETIRNVSDLRCALSCMKSFPDQEFVVSFAVNFLGEKAEKSKALLVDFVDEIKANPIAGLTAIGLNCGGGPESALLALEYLKTLTDLPVVVQPNAGEPRVVDGRTIYLNSGEYFSTYARRYVQLGAAAVGGCCGINPDHIAELVRTVKPVSDSEKHVSFETPVVAENLCTAVPLAERSNLGQKLASGRFITEIELTPPRGFDLTKTIAAAKLCKEAGVDALNLPDGPRASARITPLVVAMEVERQTGIETVPHCCGRDRSLIGLQSELLGYAGVGIHNLLFITGDPPKLGNYPFSTGVFDVDSIGLVKMQQRMNHGVDIGGEKLNAPTAVVIGVGADPCAVDLEREYARLRQKVEAGADFIVTQPIFDAAALERFLEAIKDFRKPVIAGIWPLTSLRNAEFMRTEVPGVTVPDEVMERMKSSGDSREAQCSEGIKLAVELAAKIRSKVQGFQVSAPFGRVELALEVLRNFIEK